jgi:hypothetical protein
MGERLCGAISYIFLRKYIGNRKTSQTPDPQMQVANQGAKYHIFNVSIESVILFATGIRGRAPNAS